MSKFTRCPKCSGLFVHLLTIGQTELWCCEDCQHEAETIPNDNITPDTKLMDLYGE